MPKAGYVPRNPRSGVLYPLVKSTWPRFVEQVEATGAKIPEFVTTAFESYLRCAIPEAGFLRLGCVKCGTERALPLSCKRRGLCPSCGARRMHDLAHQLVERVLPDVAIRQYVLSPPSESSVYSAHVKSRCRRCRGSSSSVCSRQSGVASVPNKKVVRNADRSSSCRDSQKRSRSFLIFTYSCWMGATSTKTTSSSFVTTPDLHPKTS